MFLLVLLYNRIEFKKEVDFKYYIFLRFYYLLIKFN